MTSKKRKPRTNSPTMSQKRKSSTEEEMKVMMMIVRVAAHTSGNPLVLNEEANDAPWSPGTHRGYYLMVQKSLSGQRPQMWVVSCPMADMARSRTQRGQLRKYPLNPAPSWQRRGLLMGMRAQEWGWRLDLQLPWDFQTGV